MSRLPKQTKRRDLIGRLKGMGFEGPLAGTGPHPEYMLRKADGRTVALPNTHRGDIGEVLLKRILRNGGISVSEYLGE